MTESPLEIETVGGSKVSVALGPTLTVVEAAVEFCATAREKNAVARRTRAVLKWAFTRIKSEGWRVCSRNFNFFFEFRARKALMFF